MLKREIGDKTYLIINDKVAITKRGDGTIELSKENYKGELEELFFTEAEFKEILEAYQSIK